MEFDPDAQFGFEIKFEDEMPKYVTLDEFKELIKEEPYKTDLDKFYLNFQKNEQNGLTYVDVRTTIFPLCVCSHILVNTCMQDPDAYDWFYLTGMYNYHRIAEFVYIWTHPYIWIPKDDIDLHGYLVLGKVASMKFDKGRVDKFLHNWLTKMLRERVLLLADKTPRATGDLDQEGQGKILKGMLAWNLITTDGRDYIRQFMYDTDEKADIEYFHTEAFRENIQFIAQERGGKVAADLVRQLRKDWQAIVTWKCFGMDKITPEHIEEFRTGLFEGMDYYLEQWDAETPQQNTPNTKPAAFEFITDLCRKEGKVERVEAELRAAAKGTAVAMWKTIRTNEALGYLSTKDVAASKIYKSLTAYFGELPYNERNFRNARNKTI